MDADRWERKRQRWERRWERRRAPMHSPGKHLFSGFLFVVLGVVFLLGNMGYLDVEQVLRFWPLILIGFGVVRLVEARDDYAQSGGMFWIVVGLLFLLGSFGIIRMAIRDLWPVLLIGIGVLMGLYLFGLVMIILNLAAFGPGLVFPEKADGRLVDADLAKAAPAL